LLDHPGQKFTELVGARRLALIRVEVDAGVEIPADQQDRALCLLDARLDRGKIFAASTITAKRLARSIRQQMRPGTSSLPAS
jgi:hypothetical protein